MTEARKPLFTLLNIDLLNRGYKNVVELPDMIETVIDAESLRFLKLGFQLDVQPATQFHGPNARRIRDELVGAMATRLMDVLPAAYESLTGNKILAGADMATGMAERLYRRAARSARCALSELASSGGTQWRARVMIKAGVDLIVSPDPHHIALRSNDDMAGGEARVGTQLVYWRLRTCVGNVTNYFDDAEFRRVWLESVPQAFPFIKIDTVDFKVYR